MRTTNALAALAALFASLAANAQAGDVYAHFIVGNAGSYSQSDWAADIAAAAASKIDGFALNIGGDGYTDTQLGYAYAAAEAHGNFKMFISFDYAANSGFSASQVESTINKYKTSKAQAQYQNKPLVSTFEGPNSAGDWTGIKSNTGCFFVPDWTSAKGDASKFSVADGALSWDIWPTTAADMTDSPDKAWRSVLGSKAYMMGVSPWFYTDLPQYNKNWLWRGNGLWWDRWQQVLEIKPEIVEIVTWNDFGESHYIGPIVQKEIVNGAQGYVNNNPHDGWRALLPYYIDAYKNGNKTATPTQDVLSWAHQPNPVKACGTGGTTGGQQGGDPTQYAEDLIDVDVALTAPADISVTIGGGQATKKSAVSAGLSHFQFPFSGQTGKVVYTVSRSGKTVMTVQGTTISASCSNVNWNAVTGSSTGSGSSASTGSTDNGASGDSSASSSTQSTPSKPATTSAAAVQPKPVASGPATTLATAVAVASPSSAPASSSPASGSGCTVNFAVKDTTVYGENIFVAGNSAALGSWATDKALALNADKYTASNPLWAGTASFPAGSTVAYKYFKKAADGSITWQGANKTMSVPQSCSGAVTQSDSVA